MEMAMRRFTAITKGASALVLVAAASVGGLSTVSAPASAATLPSQCVAQSTTKVVCTYDYNGTDGTDGSVQTLVVPPRVGAATIEAWGAQGAGPNGGLGGYIRGTVAVVPGTVLEVRVGGSPSAAAGGYNGGGNGGANAFGGGGGSDVRVAGAALDGRLVTAGGGGGSGRGENAGSPLAYRGGAGGRVATGGALVSGDPALDCNVPWDRGTFCGGFAYTLAPGAAAYNENCGGLDATAGTYDGVGGNGTLCTADVVHAQFAGAGGGGGWTGGGGGGVWAAANPTVVRAGPGGGGSSRIRVAVNDYADVTGVRSGHGLVTISYNPKGVPPTGDVICNVTNATVKSSFPLTNTPSPKPVKLLFTGTATCDGDGVIGGVAQITEATFRQTWTAAAGSTCESLPSGAAAKSQKVRMTFKGRNVQHTLVPVATVKATATTMTPFVQGFDSRGTVPNGERTAFANQETRLIAYAEPTTALADQCAGTGVSTFPFTGYVMVRTVGGG
jgi:hypothetical protein